MAKTIIDLIDEIRAAAEEHAAKQPAPTQPFDKLDIYKQLEVCIQSIGDAVHEGILGGAVGRDRETGEVHALVVLAGEENDGYVVARAMKGYEVDRLEMLTMEQVNELVAHHHAALVRH